MRTFLLDVNGTLLDLAGLDEVVADRLGDAALRPVWFQQLLQLAWVGELTGEPVDFTTAGRAAVRMVAAQAGGVVDDEDVDAVTGAMRSLPPHPDVVGGLTRLRAAGHRLVALSNSPAEVLRAQLDHAGLTDVFDLQLSAEDTGAVKPTPAPYVHAAERTGVALADLTLVAAHAWDISGALAAGAGAILVARDGAVPSPLAPPPELVVADLAELADAMADG